MVNECKVISMVNIKGGVKTTSALNLGVGLVQLGHSVLLLDTDPQGGLTVASGISNPDALDYTLATVMTSIKNDEPVLFRVSIRGFFENL